MDRPRMIISLAFFFMIITFLLWGVGNSINDPDYEYIAKAATGNSGGYSPTNYSYSHLWNNELERMGISRFSYGEYGMSDRIKIKTVYQLTTSHGEKFTQSYGDSWLDTIGRWVGLDTYHDLEWNHGTVKNISQGDPVYLYPFIDMDIPGGNSPIPDFKCYIFVRTFDAYSSSQEWIHDPVVHKMTTNSDRIQWIPRLECGLMGAYDLYYVIDVVYFNQDFLKSIPGINLITDVELEDLVNEDKARFMERYGGVIYGDNHRDEPDMIAYHEVQYSGTGGIDVFFETIKDVQMGWTAFTSTDNDVVNYGFQSMMAIFTLIFGLCIYYEIKSYLPFISGGEGS